MKHSTAVLAALTALALTACSPTVVTRGNLVSETNFAQVEAKKSTREDITRAWGTPTAISSFDNNTWYYIGETTEQKGIFAPEVKKRRLIRVRFTGRDNNTVASIDDLDPSKAQGIEPVSRTTPNAGREFTAMQQFIGNLGKYNAADKKGAPNN